MHTPPVVPLNQSGPFRLVNRDQTSFPTRYSESELRLGIGGFSRWRRVLFPANRRCGASWPATYWLAPRRTPPRTIRAKGFVGFQVRTLGQPAATPLEAPEQRAREPGPARALTVRLRPARAQPPPPQRAPERVARHRRVVDGGLRRSGAPDLKPARPGITATGAARISASPRPLVQHTGELGAQRDTDAELHPAGRRPDHPARQEGARQEGGHGRRSPLPASTVRRRALQRFIWLSRYFRIPAP